MSRWFRAYDEILNDPKVQGLEPELFRAWINILCIASKYNGTLPGTFHETEAIAFHLRISVSDARFILVSLREKNLLDEDKNGKPIPHNWGNRQYKSDSSTDRVKRSRKRQRNVSVTPPEQNRTEQITETEKISSLRSDWPSDYREKFWQAYPRRVGRGAAIRKLEQVRKRGEVSFAQLLKAIEAIDTKEEKYVPHPLTWLNQARYLDGEGAPPPLPKYDYVN